MTNVKINRTIMLYQRPVGKPELSDFKTLNEVVPEIFSGEILLKTRYVSVDPYLRGRMSDAKSYVPPFELHKVISSGLIAEVVASNLKEYQVGDFVSGLLDWKNTKPLRG